MITKIKRLKKIGKFYDFAGKANDLDWQKNTFVFAPNAYGKSTIVSVLCSLRNNNPKLILARKTLGSGAFDAPEAVIVIDGENHVFNANPLRWDKAFPSIQVFDSPYIHANILATYEIGHEHKKNIHKIIMGEQGIKLSEELAALKNDEKFRNKEVTNLEEKFKRSGFTFSIDKFLEIPPTEEGDVVKRIQKLEQTIKSKQSETIVQRLDFPRHAIVPSFNLSTAKKLATKKLTAAHETAEKQVLDHINRNLKDRTQAKQFIRQGLDLFQADCPFCGQNISNVADLLKAYREFFDEAFRDYQRDIDQQIASVAKWNLDNELTSLVSTCNANLAVSRQWESYLVIALPDLATTAEKCRDSLVELKGNILSELEKKQKDPNSDPDLSHFDALLTKLDELNAAVHKYNTAVSDFTNNAKQYITNIPKSDVAIIQEELVKEQQTSMRFTQEWKKWVTDYPIAKERAGTLLTQKKAKQNELEDYSKTIFETYQKRINELLTTLGTDFTIADLTGKTDERARESYSNFGFLILEQKVPLTARQDDVPCFRNTLSEGDKSTLAFAFFIAALENMPELDKQIVIFDDPLSSLDETRREATARLLLDLSPKVKQLNVFTHKKDFLYMLCEKLPDSKVLQICSDKKNGSRLVVLNVEEERKGDHARLIESMKRYIYEDFGPTADTMQGNLRKLFETVLKTKYYLKLLPDMKNRKGFATFLTTLFKEGLLNAELKPRLFDLCSVSNGVHHGEIVDTIPRKLTRDELIPLITEALDLVYKV
ncbi:MAG: hypothetical protein BWK80_23435 [Desulfobacteraceae bacterium IS3]|nr:MAG: hypothetical protein BWK80_23435 [Desulfobacteraceae bacterium IS3]